MQQVCQWLILIMLSVSLFASLHADFYGRKAREPYGFVGAIVTLVLIGLFFLVYYKAGALSTIF